MKLPADLKKNTSAYMSMSSMFPKSVLGLFTFVVVLVLVCLSAIAEPPRREPSRPLTWARETQVTPGILKIQHARFKATLAEAIKAGGGAVAKDREKYRPLANFVMARGKLARTLANAEKEDNKALDPQQVAEIKKEIADSERTIPTPEGWVVK